MALSGLLAACIIGPTQPPGPSASTTENPGGAPSPAEGHLADRAPAFGRIAWSPDGSTLAVIAHTGPTSELRLFDSAGHPRGTLPGVGMAWVDATHVVTLDPNGFRFDDLNLRSIDGQQVERLDAKLGQAVTGVLGNGHGAVALSLDTGGVDPGPNARSWIWSEATGMRPVQGAFPLAWSPDGRRIALLRELPEPSARIETPAGPADLVLAASAAPAVVEVRSYPALELIASVPASTQTGRVAFNPDGASVAVGGAPFPQASALLDLRTGDVSVLHAGGEPIDWLPDGRLLVWFADSQVAGALDVREQELESPLRREQVWSATGNLYRIPVPEGTGTIWQPVGSRSPDGSVVAEVRETGDGQQLWLVPGAAP